MWRLASLVCLSAALATSVMAQEQPPLPATPGAQLVQMRCVTCHGADIIVQQRLSRDGWVREVDKMIGWGATLSDAEKTETVNYLALHFARRGGPAVAEDAGTLLKTRCLGCHDTALVEQQRLTRPGWVRELDKMIGWGASLTPSERDALAAHLADRYKP
jgi:cytochrome c553